MKSKYKILLVIIMVYPTWIILTAPIYPQERPCDVGFENTMVGYCVPRVSLPIFTMHAAFADCSFDNDWPEKPCLDMPPYPKSKLVQIWDEYYSMKGQEWMEMKKSEMNYALENGILRKWLSFGTPQSGNFQNYNIYSYYFFNDRAPAVEGYYSDLLKSEDRNSYVEVYHSDLPDTDISNVIITYYYISAGGLLVLSSVIAAVGIIGFLVWRKRK